MQPGLKTTFFALAIVLMTFGFALGGVRSNMLDDVTLDNWDTGEHRRTALHNFDKLIRYGMTVRGAKVLRIQ